MKITLQVELDEYDSPTRERGGRHLGTTISRSVDVVVDDRAARWEAPIKSTTDMLAAAITDALVALDDAAVKA